MNTINQNYQESHNPSSSRRKALAAVLCFLLVLLGYQVFANLSYVSNFYDAVPTWSVMGTVECIPGVEWSIHNGNYQYSYRPTQEEEEVLRQALIEYEQYPYTFDAPEYDELDSVLRNHISEMIYNPEKYYKVVSFIFWAESASGIVYGESDYGFGMDASFFRPSSNGWPGGNYMFIRDKSEGEAIALAYEYLYEFEDKHGVLPLKGGFDEK